MPYYITSIRVVPNDHVAVKCVRNDVFMNYHVCRCNINNVCGRNMWCCTFFNKSCETSHIQFNGYFNCNYVLRTLKTLQLEHDVLVEWFKTGHWPFRFRNIFKKLIAAIHFQKRNCSTTQGHYVDF